MESSQGSPKRRKPNTSIDISLGKTIISLDGYLNGSSTISRKARLPQKFSSQTAEQEGENQPSWRSSDKEIRQRCRDQGKNISAATQIKKSSCLTPKVSSAASPALLKARQRLPIWQYRAEIQAAFQGSRDDGLDNELLGKPHNINVIILVGETGSGKSTQVPQFLYEEGWCVRQMVKDSKGNEFLVGGIIAITQPRRVAATTLAHRVAQEAGTPLGKGRKDGKVGYSVRFDHHVPKGAKIKYLTEGMLLQELLRDPNLRQYSAVIIDEIHERSLDADLLIGFLKQIVTSDNAGRGGVPLKVAVMSATADVDKIREFFTKGTQQQQQLDFVKVLRIKGRQYSVQIFYEPKPVPDIPDVLIKTIFRIHMQEQLPGDILAFLTGQEEIEAAQKLIEEYAGTLASNVPKIKVCPLYGQLSIEVQRDAFLPAKASFTRKVILATNIAETSVTVPGVRYVVDCGKAKVKQFRSRLGMESLLAKPISKSSAVQRAGRAGREGPGKCFRLYTESSFDTLQEADLPEILRNDVLGAVLTMKAKGIRDVLAFPLIDAPDITSIKKSLVQLHFLGALDDEGCITLTGGKMARLPISAPLAAVLLAAARPEYDCVLEAIDVISCITSGDDIFLHVQSQEGEDEVEPALKELQRREGDLITYLTAMQQYTAENADRTSWCKQRKINIRIMRQALNVRRQLRGLALKEKLLVEAAPPDPQPFVPISPERAEDLLKCFLRGFATKTAMLHPDASYVTVQGKHVVAIHPSSVMHGQKREAIMFLEHVFTNKSYARKVSAIQAVWIAEALEFGMG